jgi:hypothetical protein
VIEFSIITNKKINKYMNFIPALNNFFDVACKDNHFNMAHLCIYIALFQCWNKNHFVNPVKIKRIEIMRLSKVNAKTTYHKCIKDLQLAGYIKYEPSFHPRGSSVYMLKL